MVLAEDDTTYRVVSGFYLCPAYKYIEGIGVSCYDAAMVEAEGDVIQVSVERLFDQEDRALVEMANWNEFILRRPQFSVAQSAPHRRIMSGAIAANL